MKRETLTQVHNRNKPVNDYAPDRKFYQSRRWRTFRAKLLKDQFEADLREIIEMHSQGHGKWTYDQFQMFINSQRPYCRASFLNGELRPADVLDHITAIRSGGNPFDTNNLQWLTHQQHNAKRQAEGRANG